MDDSSEVRCKKSIITIVIILLIISLFFNDTFAQDSVKTKGIYDLSLDELRAVIITPSKKSQSQIQVTQKVDVLDSNDINKSISERRNLSELIQYFVGSSVTVLSRNDVNWGSYGGIGPKYSIYLLQGLPIDAFMEPTSIDVLSISQIELQRGPNAILYPNWLSHDFAGCQSSIAGIINLIIKDKVEETKTIISAEYGSFNTISLKAKQSLLFNDVNLIGTISFENSDYTRYDTENSWLNMFNNPNYSKLKLSISASYYFDEEGKSKITLFGNNSIQTGNFGRENRNFNYNYSLVNFGYQNEISNSINISLKAGLRNYDREWEDDNVINFVSLLTETNRVRQFIMPFDFSLSYSHLNESQLIIGIDYQRASYKTDKTSINMIKLEGNLGNSNQGGIYIQEELRLDKFIVRGGMRYNITEYDINKVDNKLPEIKNKKWNKYLWSIGAKYLIDNNVSIYSNVGTSFLTPGLKSIGGTISLFDFGVTGKNGQFPNGSLKPESGLSFDFGIDCFITKNFFIAGRIFGTFIDDAIIDVVVNKSPSQTISINTPGKTVITGIELNTKHKISSKIEIFANTTINSTKMKNEFNEDENNIEIPFVPNYIANIGFNFILPYDINFSPYVRFGGYIYDSNSKKNRTKINYNEVLNLFISKKISTYKSLKPEIYLKIYNLTDNRFEMPWQFKDTGLSFTFGIITEIN